MFYHPYRKELYPEVLRELDKFSDEKQREFFAMYEEKRKVVKTAYMHWIFWSHYLYLEKFSTHRIYRLTGAGLYIWGIIDLFRIPKMVKDYNN